MANTNGDLSNPNGDFASTYVIEMIFPAVNFH